MVTYVSRLVSPELETELALPFLMSRIQAGKPEEPSHDDHALHAVLDLNRDLLKNPQATVFAELGGDDMPEEGLYSDSILAINREGKIVDGCLAVVIIGGQLAVKKISIRKEKLRVISARNNYEPIEIDETANLEVFGVVEFSIRRHMISPGRFALRVV